MGSSNCYCKTINFAKIKSLKSPFKRRQKFMFYRPFIIVLITFTSSFVLNAQKLLSPEEFLPYKYGEQFTPHNLLVDYYKHVAANSPLVQLKEYGRTNEYRPLLFTVISSKENLANLEKIRLSNLYRAGLVSEKPAEMPNIPIVWLSMNVHGNEPASSETSMTLLYNLVNPNRADVKEWLKNTIVIIDPCVNPDGYNRYTQWYLTAADKMPNPNPDAREHREPWPGGRVNHYLFDLNRDWAWLSQIESQQRVAEYQKWIPQICADFHEMGYNQPYYFAPATQPFHHYITPFQKDFQTEIGRNHAKYFDKEGWLYFTKEEFDLFYPSYGDTYPTYNGAIGMTYEQGGIGAGRTIQLNSGNYLTLKDRIAHHLATALSTIEMASKNADKLCINFERFYAESRTTPPGIYKSYIVKNSTSPNRVKAFCDLLDKHNIRYGKVNATRTVSAFNYLTKHDESTEVNAEDVVISAYQPHAVLAQILLDPESELNDSATYDITAWTLPYAYGLNAFASKERLDVTVQPYSKTFQIFQKPAERPYGYVATWKDLNNAKFATSLLNSGVKIRVATTSFDVAGKTFQRGSLVITRGDNQDVGERLDREVTAAALKNSQEITPVTTGFMDFGPDFGSVKFTLMQKPNIAIIQDEDVDNNSYGQMWYFFEQDLNTSVTQIKLTDLIRDKISGFNVICMTDGNYGNLDAAKLDKIRSWVNDGGKLILIGEALAAFEDKKGFELTKFAVKKDKEAAEESETANSLKHRFMHFDDYERDALSESVPGAIVKVNLDNTHPLAYGMNNVYYSLKTTGVAFQPLKNSYNVGVMDEKSKPIGFVGYRAKQNLSGSMIFAVQMVRHGSIVYMSDNPLFRAFWYQGKFLFSNAVLMPMR